MPVNSLFRSIIMTPKVSCPTCKTSVLWQAESSYRPFCSKRCKLIDLGEWASEGYNIPQPAPQDPMLTEEMLDALGDELLATSAGNGNFFVEPE